MNQTDTANKRAAVLGSTGSVGLQAIDSLGSLGWEFPLIAGNRNVSVLESQARKYNPEVVAVTDLAAGRALRTKLADTSVKVVYGEDAICNAIIECDAPLIVHSIAGLAGLPSALAAAETGHRIAMANKEAIISAGDMIYARLNQSEGELIPVDSEHSAIFQCLTASGAANPKAPADSSMVKSILLTASGGPFFGQTADEMKSVTAEMALRHPTWKMGPKITIDCASMMNKGFELIEACRLFGVTPDQVKILVHRESIIHSMVEYIDNTVIAQMGLPDMRSCIRYAAYYPDRVKLSDDGRLDLTQIGKLTFYETDTEAFPLTETARHAAAVGGTAPTALIAVDEAAVAAFINGKIGFIDMMHIVDEAMTMYDSHQAISDEDIFEAWREAAELAEMIIKKYEK